MKCSNPIDKVSHDFTVKNTLISSNFLVWTFCGKAQFPHSFARFANIEAIKLQLQQRKFKKFNYPKHKPQPIKEQTPSITQTNFKKSYTNAVKGNTNITDSEVQHLRKTSKTNILEESPTLLKKLELLHPAHTQHHCGKSTKRDKKIEDLRNQIKLLKQRQKEHDTQEQPKHT